MSTELTAGAQLRRDRGRAKTGGVPWMWLSRLPSLSLAASCPMAGARISSAGGAVCKQTELQGVCAHSVVSDSL